MAQKAKGGKKQRKHGRNKSACEIYAREDRATKNQIIRLRKRVESHPQDKVAELALKRLVG